MRTMKTRATTGPSGAGRLVGISAWAVAARERIQRVALHDTSVLITGPSGTGKELIARAIHEVSSRADAPFIPVDCAAIVPTLFPSHMFGHCRGAFTGAEHATLGCFRAAEGGTIFLDEIGELPLEVQAQLLRALQERTVVPVGGVDPRPVDVRLVAATNRDLDTEVKRGAFREDLYYRLKVVDIPTQPLHNRPEDIPLLADHVLAQLSDECGLPRKTLSVDAIMHLQRLLWPGNVRQLAHFLEKAVVFTDQSVVTAQAIAECATEAEGTARMIAHPSPAPLRVSDPGPARAAEECGSPAYAASQDAARIQAECFDQLPDSVWLSLDELEAYHLRQTLEHTFYNQSAAADLLNISRRVLSRLIRKHGIDTSLSTPGRRRRPER
jgi:DNA-binding NtrC family response regulator